MNATELEPFLHYAKGSKVGGIVVAFVCFGIGAVGFADSTATLGLQLGLAIPFALIGVGLLYVAFRPAEKHPAIVLLREHAPEIVWIYASTQRVNGVHSQTFLNFGLASGKQKMLAIGAKTDPEPLLQRLHASIGHATFGYSPELEAQYKKTPASLRQGGRPF
ncbi:MAG: hypothetical protein IPJ34_08385 [Myxococcales bacterium]|nr:hypothetical protein [Myxococcales bacterium]